LRGEELIRHTSAPGSSEGNKYILVLANLLLEGLVIEVYDLARQLSLDLGLDVCLFLDELAQALEITSSGVVGWLVALSIEPLEGGEA